MSHFSVMVRIAASVRSGDLEKYVGRVLDPYCEHDDKGRLAQYLKFVDDEDKYKQEYEIESVEMVRLDGKFVYTWSDEFKARARAHLKMRLTGIDALFGPNLNDYAEKLRAAFEYVEVKHRERYATFEDFMRDWAGYETRDAETGRYGHHANSNAKWDYWRIGGRWRGDLLIRETSRTHLLEVGGGGKPIEAGLGEVGYEFEPGFHDGPVPGNDTEVDYCRIASLDLGRIESESRKRAEKFWAEFDQFVSGHEFPIFEGPRSALLALGILDCKNASEIASDVWWKQAWQRDANRFDVIATKPDRAKLEEIVLTYHNPIRPWAYVDENGWRERGRMGWFGAGSDTPESNEQHANAFMKWLLAGDRRDWIVMVDCHI